MGRINEKKDIDKLEQKIDYKFKNNDLLVLSLTHKSYPTKQRLGMIDNEKLEFVGDSVLNFLITDHIFNKYSALSEGNLTKLRARIVNSEMLVEAANKIRLGDYIFLSKAAEISGGRKISSIIGDSMEALIGAIFLDGGIESANKFVDKHFAMIIEEQYAMRSYSDFKSMLQEKTVKIYGETPVYRIIKETGPVHDKTFYSEVEISGKPVARGKGKSKKNAELDAAKKALHNIDKKKTKGIVSAH